MEVVALSDLELAITQLESWIENRTKVELVFESGFVVGFNEPGTLDRWEGHFVFRNSLVTVTFNLRNAVPEVRFQDDVYQIRLRYGCGILTVFETKNSLIEKENV